MSRPGDCRRRADHYYDDAGTSPFAADWAAVIVILMVINLRGVREAGALFVLPTYVFIGSPAALPAWGPFQMATGRLGSVHTHMATATEGVGLLRAFAGGCTAMTGVSPRSPRPGMHWCAAPHDSKPHTIVRTFVLFIV